MLDYLIKNATVIDGSGKKGSVLNIGIKNGKLVINPQTDSALEMIDATGLTLSSGFIDTHGHSDLFAFIDPLRASKLCQGITTEIGGQCGISPAPIAIEHFADYCSYYKALGAPIYPNAESFKSVGNLLDTIETLNMGINLAMFTAQGSLRLAVKGLNPSPATEDEIKLMGKLARESLEEGSLGLSTGLMYAPGVFTTTEELTRLCSYLKGTNAIYTSHIRNQGNGLIDSVKEALEIAKKAGLKANVSHHKAVGKENWGKVEQTTKMLKEAGATHDVYPYIASSTTLSATLPPKFVKMGMENILKGLNDKAFIDDLENSIIHPTEKWDDDLLECGFDGILIISSPNTPEALGLTIEQYANKLGLRSFDAFIKLLKENEGAVSDICFSMSQADVDYLVAEPTCMYGTDSLYVPGFMTMTHPRAIGTFPLILGDYVRERKLLSLEESIRKMTGFAADVYGLENKGYVREGFDADLVVFDYKTVNAKCSYQKPLEENIGIKYVFVNGKLAVKDGKTTGVKNGHVLRGR